VDNRVNGTAVLVLLKIKPEILLPRRGYRLFHALDEPRECATLGTDLTIRIAAAHFVDKAAFVWAARFCATEGVLPAGKNPFRFGAESLSVRSLIGVLEPCGCLCRAKTVAYARDTHACP
jgi:hypothetical protein